MNCTSGTSKSNYEEIRVLEHRHSGIYAVSDGSWHAMPERTLLPGHHSFTKFLKLWAVCAIDRWPPTGLCGSC